MKIQSLLPVLLTALTLFSLPAKSALKCSENKGELIVMYDHTVILSTVKLWGANSKWNGNVFLTFRREEINRLNTEKEISGVKTIKHLGECSYKISLRMLPDKTEIFDYEATYRYTPPTQTKFVCFEAYLSKDFFFEKLKNTRISHFSNLHTSNELGDFEFTLNAFSPDGQTYGCEAGTALENFREDRFKTFRIINTAAYDMKTPAIRTIRFRMKFKPSGNIGMLGTLHAFSVLVKQLPETVGADERDDLQKRIEILKKKQDAAGFVELEDKLTALIRRKEMCSSGDYGGGRILPTPVKRRDSGGAPFLFTDKTCIIVPSNADSRLLLSAGALQKELKLYRGLDLRILKQDVCPSGNVCIRGDLEQKHRDGEYTLTISPEAVTIRGAGARGAFYGVQSLIQLAELNHEGRLEVPSTVIHDYPYFNFRAISLNFDLWGGGRQLIPHAIERWGGRYKYSHAIIGENGTGFLKWNSHPEITTRKISYSMDDMRGYQKNSNENFLEFIPRTQFGGGHSESILKAHPELADDPESGSHDPLGTLNLNDPRVRAFIGDMMDEMLSAFKPGIINIGGDELFSVGALCKDKKPYQIFADHINFVARRLASENTVTYLCHDMLLKKRQFNMTPGTSKGTENAVDLIDKKIILEYWNYSDMKHPAIEYFQNKGFRVVGASWNSSKSAYAMAEELLRLNAYGHVSTAYCFCGFQRANFVDLVLLEKAWSPNQPDYEAIMKRSPVEHLQHSLFHPQPSEMVSTTTKPILFEGNLPLELVAEEGVDETMRRYKGLSAFQSGKQVFCGINFDIPAKCLNIKNSERAGSVKIGFRAKGLVFLHSGGPAFVYGGRIGTYTVHYDDGTKGSIPLTGMYNIAPLYYPRELLIPSSVRPMYDPILPQSKRAWTGWNLSGDVISVQAYEWLNPHPDKVIVRVDVTANQDCHLNLFGLSAVVPR